MEIVVGFFPGLILAVIAAVMIRRDPRRLRCAVFSGVALYVLILHAYLLFTQWSWDTWGEGVAYLIPVVVAVALLGIMFLGVLLVHYGVVLLRREGMSLSHALSLALGLLILTYTFATVAVVIVGAVEAFFYLFLLALPLVYLAFVLVIFVFYQGIYGFWAKRLKYSPPVIVVLGSGIMEDRLPPLLRARVDLGIKRYRIEVAEGRSPLLALSGGQGPGEIVPESKAMEKYCLENGVPGGDILVEADSRNTEQNLKFTENMLRQRGNPLPWLIATSDFHAFRAANLMSMYAISGQAIGARTPRYFWSAAILREYAALLKYHWKINLAFVVIAFIPLIVFIGSTVASF